MRHILISVCVVLLGGTSVLAQELQRCAAVLNAAAASMYTECADTPLMSMCYGNGPISVAYSEDADDLTFTNPGDVVSLDMLDTLTAGGANIAAGEWGLIAFNMRVNITDVSALIFSLGSVRIENEGDPAADIPSTLIPVTFPEGANIRAEPDANAEQTGVIYVGDSVRATGILMDGTWVRIVDEEGEVGWVTVTAFDDDVLGSLQPVTDAIPEAAAYGSMQALSLRTGGAGEASCPFIPPNGLIVQTPEATETMRLRVNDAALHISPLSTVFLTAGDDEILRVDVLEGAVEVNENPVEPSFGAVIREGEDIEIAPYDYDRVSRLTVGALPRPIFVPLDFSTIVQPPPGDGSNPLAGITLEDTCTIGATIAPANLREDASPGSRVRHVMQLNESATPDGRGRGTDGALWWRLAPAVWVSSNAVIAVGDCGKLPIVSPY